MSSSGSSSASGSGSPAAASSSIAAGSATRQLQQNVSSSDLPPFISSTNGDSGAASSHNLDADASNQASTSASVPLAGKRSRSGCLTCRKRKKKCDETLCEETGGCWRCRNAGYQCEGFRRAPVVFAPGTASSSKGKRTKRSPEADSPGTGSRVKLEPGANGYGNGLADAQSAALGHASFTSVGAAGGIDQESLDMANSLAEFAGLATSSAAWPLANDMAATGSHDSMSKDATSTSNFKNGAPSSYTSFAHPSMLPPAPQRPLPPDSSLLPLQSPMIPCEIVGDCLFSGHHLCASCSAVANRLMQPDPAALAALDADLVQVAPSLSTPTGSRHHSPALDGYTDTHAAAHHANAKSRLVMESLIGYYSTLIVCWVQGCDVRGLEASTLFRQLVPYLLDSVDKHPPLRLSIAAVTAGYVGGARLTWPKDVVAIHQWANTLRADRTSIADCVKANLTFGFPGTPDTIWSASPGSEPHGKGALSPANVERLRRASSTHATLDDLLVGQAQTLKHLAVRSLEQAVADYKAKTTRAMGVSFTEKGFIAECVHVNPLLMASLNIAIYAFAEEGMTSYFEEAARMRGLIETLLGSFPPVNLSKLTSHEHLGFRTYVWSDVTTAIACGTRPHLQLALSTYITDVDVTTSSQDLTFSMIDVILVALSDIARLRYEFDGGDFSRTARRQAGVPIPQWVRDRAKRIQARAESCRIKGPLTTGSAICAVMTKSACIILIHTLIYRLGALHPIIVSLLRSMLDLWTSAGEKYCKSVGCSNFNLPMFVASSVAVSEEDRRICESAMKVVGHEEAGPASGRELIREVWRRNDVTGVPCFWTDVVASGEYAVAFF
ncbi:Zn(2)-C6 fungal-type DNA-binding domain protein [Kalmanozyma brasiliensis GHG001]|uniref:Zn(2)-C6 fungal-type domain-containing protein n=1 Tax=Kalmanozyma brasiliensis (strain GHG001) TaxID=1365824 RepID=V5ER54_KALBG|nr:Zn(2)-C6 fungal-type DNA-binding domain protein [Kalmanozyma brasiliensis GHG001]EST05428.1 Zn(2)-C6 fungal-type DNA-binding domain protein [Kalmanozyma brasiliensis GHG001]